MTDDDRMPQRRRDDQWPTPPGPPDDEISLFDLWLVMMRRRLLMAAIFLAVSGGGLVFALMQGDVYEYSATLAIGQTLKPGGGSDGLTLAPVQKPAGVVAEIQSVHAPAAVRDVVGQAQSGEYIPEVNVSSPEGSDSVVLSGETATANADTLKRTMQGIAQRQAAAHESRIQDAQRTLEQKIASTENELEQLQARKETLSQRLDDLLAREKELQQRRQEVDSELERLREQRDQRASGSANIGLMSLNGQIASVRSELNRIDDQLNQQIPEARREGRLERIEVRSEIDLAKTALSQSKARLNQLEPTRLSSEPQRSLKPSGTSGKLILALSIVLGAMLAVFGAFVWEFVTRANAYVREQENE